MYIITKVSQTIGLRAHEEYLLICVRITTLPRSNLGKDTAGCRIEAEYQARHRWAESILWPQRPLESTKGSLGLPPWADSHPAVTPPPGTPPRTVWQARLLSEQWCWERWHELHGGPPPRIQLLDPDPGGGDGWKPDRMPYRASLRLRAGLSKAQSSILTQMRTGKIGLAAFLCRRQVPGFPTPACCCGAQWETAKHVVLECPRLQRVRRSLYTAAATTDYQVMISRPRPAAALTSWILRYGVLPQFSWAQEQLDTGY